MEATHEAKLTSFVSFYIYSLCLHSFDPTYIFKNECFNYQFSDTKFIANGLVYLEKIRKNVFVRGKYTRGGFFLHYRNIWEPFCVSVDFEDKFFTIDDS